MHPGDNADLGREPLTALDIPGLRRLTSGKVREVFDLGERLLIVATDRVSAFDVVLPTPIPDKGRILTQMTLHWLTLSQHIVPNHLISESPEGLGLDNSLLPLLRGRSMVVWKAKVLPVECVVRGYLSGSAWKEYRESGRIGDVPLPPGMGEAAQLAEPIFTPTTKAVSGHDEPLTLAQVEGLVGKELAARLRDHSLAVYGFAADYAWRRGLIVCDTKFEFGLVDGELLLVDEVLTPDSSRFWDGAAYQPGMRQDGYDKQIVRDYLESLGWNKQPPAPSLPPDIVAATRQRYQEVFQRLFGE